jgi:hypothetical protein
LRGLRGTSKIPDARGIADVRKTYTINRERNMDDTVCMEMRERLGISMMSDFKG